MFRPIGELCRDVIGRLKETAGSELVTAQPASAEAQGKPPRMGKKNGRRQTETAEVTGTGGSAAPGKRSRASNGGPVYAPNGRRPTDMRTGPPLLADGHQPTPRISEAP